MACKAGSNYAHKSHVPLKKAAALTICVIIVGHIFQITTNTSVINRGISLVYTGRYITKWL